MDITSAYTLYEYFTYLASLQSRMSGKAISDFLNDDFTSEFSLRTDNYISNSNIPDLQDLGDKLIKNMVDKGILTAYYAKTKIWPAIAGTFNPNYFQYIPADYSGRPAIKANYNNSIGLVGQVKYQHRDNDTSEVSNSSSYNLLRLLEQQADGKIADTHKTIVYGSGDMLMNTMLTYLGIQPTAGAIQTNDLTQRFFDTYADDEDVKNYSDLKGNIVGLLGLDNGLYTWEWPTKMIDKMGEFIKANSELFEDNVDINVTPELNTDYTSSNPLPLFNNLGKIISPNTPSDPTAAAAYAILAGIGLGSIISELYSTAYNYNKAAYEGSTYAGQYGNFANWFQSIAMSFGTGSRGAYCRLTLACLNIYYNANGNAAGVKFYVNDNGEMNTNNERTTTTTLDARPSSGTNWRRWLVTYTWHEVESGGSHLQLGTHTQATLTNLLGVAGSVGEFCYWSIGNLDYNSLYNHDTNATQWDETQETCSDFISRISNTAKFVSSIADVCTNTFLNMFPVLKGIRGNAENVTSSQAAVMDGTDPGIFAEDDDLDLTDGVPYIPPALTSGLLGDIIGNLLDVLTPDVVQDITEEQDIAVPINIDIPIAETEDIDITTEGDSQYPTPTMAFNVPDTDAGSLVTAYDISKTELTAMSKYMWSNTFLNLWNNLVNSGNAMETAILGLFHIYIPESGTMTSSATLKIGGITVESGGNPVSTSMFTKRYGKWQMGQKIKIVPKYNNYLDYQSQYQLFLPFVGFCDLNPSDVLEKESGTSLIVEYNVDVYTGTVVYNVFKNDTNHLIMTASGNCAAMIPISNKDFSQALSGSLQAVAGAVTGNMAAAAGGVMGAMGGMYGSMTTKFNVSCAAGVMSPLSIFVKITRPVIGSKYNLGPYNGFPDMQVHTLTDLHGTGYAEIDTKGKFLGSYTCTKEELDEIKQLLESGVLF